MNKNSKDKKNNSIVGIIVVAAVFLLSVGGAALIIPLLIIGVMAYVIYTLSKQANQKSGDASGTVFVCLSVMSVSVISCGQRTAA